VRASLQLTFAALLEQLAPENDTPEGVRMNKKIEAWPGGRWVRDLGDDNGHFWGGGAGDQAADAARIPRAAVHVISGGFQCAVPIERKRWRNADQVSPRGVRADRRGTPGQRGEGMVTQPRKNAQGGRKERVAVIERGWGQGAFYVPKMRGECSRGSGRRGFKRWACRDGDEDAWREQERTPEEFINRLLAGSTWPRRLPAGCPSSCPW
jgi:hypothetical protein